MHLQATVGLRHVRAGAVHRPRDDGDGLPAGPADAPAVRRVARLPVAGRAGTRRWPSARIVNAFFRWEFNSCEMLVAGDEVYPIDYANACPDVAVTSLHYYFPWAITALVRWSVFCLVTGRTAAGRPRDRAATSRSPTTRSWTTPTSSRPYLALADEHFETERYHDWCAHAPGPPRGGGPRLGHLGGRSTGCCARPCRRRTRRTSRTSSWPTSAACSTCGWPTSAETALHPAQGGGDDLAGLGLDLGEVLGALERLGVDLVDVLGAGRPRGEPGVLGGDLEAADRAPLPGAAVSCPVIGSPASLVAVTSSGRERGQLGLLLAGGRRVDPGVGRVAVLGDQVGVVLARRACR